MPEITAQGLLGNQKKNDGLFGEFALNEIFGTVIGGLIISKIYGIGLIKSFIGLFLFIIFLKLVLGIKSELVSDLISQVDV